MYMRGSGGVCVVACFQALRKRRARLGTAQAQRSGTGRGCSADVSLCPMQRSCPLSDSRMSLSAPPDRSLSLCHDLGAPVPAFSSHTDHFLSKQTCVQMFRLLRRYPFVDTPPTHRYLPALPTHYYPPTGNSCAVLMQMS
ncbi:hypothetical protein J6590_008462 [Homalodisca vitripennis]|nr:hypothetical protein J6590_008462 [Homalodisca vitripennis]